LLTAKTLNVVLGCWWKEKGGQTLNEIQNLSNDLNVITAEINSYKQVAGQAIFEIGKRLKHVKENDLVHGEFGNWLRNIEMSNQQASRFIKVYEELPEIEFSDVGKIGLNALYEIATLPPEEREKEHTLSNGETKTPDEMTNQELREVKKQLRKAKQAQRQAEKQVEQAKKSEEIALRKLEEEQSKEPEKIEVVPDDYDFYKGNYNSAISLQKRYKEQMEEMRKELNSVNETDDELEKERRKKETLQLKADNDVLSLANNIDDFLKENAVTSYREGAIASSDEMTKETLREGINALKSFASEIERSLNGRIKI